MAQRPLPSELVSLVHHTELNKVGWWDKTIQQLILSVMWLSGGTGTACTLVDSLKESLHVDVDPMRVSTQVEHMLKHGMLLPAADGGVSLSENTRRQLESDAAHLDKLNSRVRERFVSILRECCPSLQAESQWDAFVAEFMRPLVQAIGARTYQLISGAAVDIERTPQFIDYIGKCARQEQQGLRSAVIRFLDPKDPDVRSFVLRHLNAYFAIEAGSLQAGTVDSLIRLVDRPPSFRIFVDTNFLFSFLDLHDNPSNEAAKSLVALTERLRTAACKFYVAPETMDEFKRVVEAQRDFLRALELPDNLASVALEMDLSGVARKFVEFSRSTGHPVSAETYFEPYLSDLIPTLRHKKVDFFNDSMNGYSMRQDVIDDIESQRNYEERHFGRRAKTYAQLRHDVVLWHFVKDKRPARVESPVDATYWIVTVDYHYLGFDEFKQSETQNPIPICLHPTSLIQMLQFWLPRTEQFERAILDSIRLPLLFQEFDATAEQVTVKILETLAHFEGADQLPKDVVGNILLNRALRQSLALEPSAQKQVQLIKEAIIEENQKIRSELRATSEERNRLALVVDETRREIQNLKAELAEKGTRISHLTTEIEAREVAPAEVILPRSRGPESHEKHNRVYFSAAAMLSLALYVVSSSLVTEIMKPHFGVLRTDIVLWAIGFLAWALLVGRVGRSNPFVNSWGAFQAFLKYKKELFALIIFAVAWDSFESLKGMAIGLFTVIFKK